MVFRRFHHKNRHGCYTCKQRRKRCNLEKPVCDNCRRLGLTCHYAIVLRPRSTRPGSVIAGSSTMTYTPRLLPPLHQAITTLLGRAESIDLELASHLFRTPDVFSMPGLKAVSKLDLDVKALRYPYLTHGLLVASALNVAILESESLPIYGNRARLHQQAALTTYMRSLEVVDAFSCHFIFGFSLILACLQFGFTAVQIHKEEQWSNNDFIDEFTTIADLLHGTVAVASATRKWMPANRFDPILMPTQRLLHDDKVPIPAGVDEKFEILNSELRRLSALAYSQDGNEQPIETTICLVAATKLRNVFRNLDGNEQVSMKALLAWLAFTDYAYIELVRQRHPPALVVLSYFAVGLHRLQHLWWLRNIGFRLVQAVKFVLEQSESQDWVNLLQWPLWMTGSGDKAESIEWKLTRPIPDFGLPEKHANISDGERHSSFAKDESTSNGKPIHPFDIAFDGTYTRGFSAEDNHLERG